VNIIGLGEDKMKRIKEYDYDRLMEVFDIHIKRYEDMKKELDKSIEAVKSLKQKFIEIKDGIIEVGHYDDSDYYQK